MMTLKTFFCRAFGVFAAIFSINCAFTGHQTLVRTAPGEEMAFDRMPTSVQRPASIAAPALAPCRLAAPGSDIVCALVTLDGTYYAAMRGRGVPDVQQSQDLVHELNDGAAAEVATDD